MTVTRIRRSGRRKLVKLAKLEGDSPVAVLERLITRALEDYSAASRRK